MGKRLKVCFIHSTKYDYNELLYKPILSSKVCISHDLILPMTSTYKAKYAKDLINQADIIIAEVSKSSFGERLELKWAAKARKPIIFISFNNKVPFLLKKYVPSLELLDDNNNLLSIINNFIIKYDKIINEEKKNQTVLLGNIN